MVKEYYKNMRKLIIITISNLIATSTKKWCCHKKSLMDGWTLSASKR